MNRLASILLILFFIGTITSCIREYDCHVDPTDQAKRIEDGFTSASNKGFISQLDPESIDELSITNGNFNSNFEKNTFIKFNDLTEIKESVRKAKLRLYVKQNPAPSIPNSTYLLKISAINEDWKEKTLSFENSPEVTHYSTKMFKPDTLRDKMLFEIDVTDILNYQYEALHPHYGFNLSLNIENNNETALISFYSSDSKDSIYWPQIDIEYGEPANKAFPKIYYSVDDSWGGAWDDGIVVKAATFSTATQKPNHEYLLEYSPMPASADISINHEDIPTLYYFRSDINVHRILSSDTEDEDIVYQSSEIQKLLFLDDFGNDVYVAASSDQGGVYILQMNMKDKSTKIIYHNSATGDIIHIKDFEEAEPIGVFYWIETEQNSGKIRIMKYEAFNPSQSAQVVFDESDFTTGFSPKALTMDPYQNKIYVVGDNELEKGVFYVANLDGSTSFSKIEINSSYKDNISDLEVDEDGNYLYWMNSSDQEVLGGIMRAEVDGNNPEVVYGNIINGYFLELEY
jgi:hypothetical protein